MSRVGRYVKLTAREGGGDALAQAMLRAAGLLADAPGCELYVINRSPAEPDAVWVTEIWSSQADLDRSLTLDEVKASIQTVLPLLAGQPERIDTLPLGGQGLSAP